MKNRYLIFTNKVDGLIDLLDFSEDIALFENNNNLCIIHFQKGHWAKKHLRSEDVNLEEIQKINKNKEVIIIAADEIASLETLLPLFSNINKFYSILHK